MKEDNLIVTSANQKLTMKFGYLEEMECNMVFVLQFLFEVWPNKPSIMEGDVAEYESIKPKFIEHLKEISNPKSNQEWSKDIILKKSADTCLHILYCFLFK